MDKQKINKHIDQAADDAKETMDLFAEKLDAATQCASQTGTRAKDKIKEGVLRATNKVEEAVTTAADRVREKVHK